MLSRTIKGRRGYIQRCVGYEMHRTSVKGKRLRIKRVYWYADDTIDKTVAGLRQVVELAKVGGKFRPTHYMKVEPVIESVRVPIWSLAFWIGKISHVNSKFIVRRVKK